MLLFFSCRESNGVIFVYINIVPLPDTVSVQKTFTVVLLFVYYSCSPNSVQFTVRTFLWTVVPIHTAFSSIHSRSRSLSCHSYDSGEGRRLYPLSSPARVVTCLRKVPR